MEKPRWVMSDRFYTGFRCRVTVSVMEQSSTRLKRKTNSVALPSSSYFNRHIRNSTAWTIYQLPHHFHHLLCVFFSECNRMRRIGIHDVLCSPPLPMSLWRCEDGEHGSHCVSVHARMSKFSHLLRLADNFWWWVTIRVKQSYLGLFKCICNHVFVISSSSHSASCFLSFSISGALPQPGPVAGRETQDEYRAGFVHLCQVVLLCLIPRKCICWDYQGHGNTVLIPQTMRLVKLGCFAFLPRCFMWGHYGTLSKSLLILLLCNSTHD